MTKQDEQRRVPKLRFKGFSEDWEQRELGDVVQKVPSYPISRNQETFKKTLTKYIHYGDIHLGIANIIDQTTKIPYIFDDSKYIPLKVGDLIFADASEDEDGIARACYIKDVSPKYDIVGGSHTIATRPINSIIDSEFLYYFSQVDSFKKFARKMATGAKINGITYANLALWKYREPKYENEKKKIINMIKNISFLITLHNNSYNAQKRFYDTLKQMIFKHKIITHKSLDNRVVEKRLEEIVNYDTSKKSLNTLRFSEEGYPVYDANKLLGYLSEYDVDRDYVSIIKDGAGVGRLRVLPEKTSVISTMGYIIPKEFSAKYVSHHLSTINFNKYIVGSTIPHIYFKDYKKETLYVHSEDTAKFYEKLLDNLKLKIQNTETKISKLKKLKSSLLNNLFV